MSTSAITRAVSGIALSLCSTPCMASDPALATIAAMSQASSQSSPASTRPTASGASKSLGDRWYLVGDVGGAFVPDINIKSFNRSSSSAGLSNASIDLDTGVRFDLGIGYAITPNFGVEIASGLIWNSVDRVRGTITPPVGASQTLSGGSGDIYNVPIMLSGEFRLPIAKDVNLILGAGIGAVWSDASISDIRSSGLPAARASIDDNDWGFGYQANIGAQWVLTSNLSLGVGYAFLGITELDYGDVSFTGVALTSSNSIRTKGTFTSSVLATLRWNF